MSSEEEEFKETTSLIDWCKFSQIMNGANVEGVNCTMIISYDGSLLATSGNLTKDEKRIIPPMVVSIWKTTQLSGHKFINALGLEFMFFYCQKGIVSVTHLSTLGKYFVCLLADKNIQLGYLKVKTELVADQLAKPIFDDWDINDNQNNNNDNNNNNIINID